MSIILSVRQKDNKGINYVKGQGKTRHQVRLAIFGEMVKEMPGNQQKDFKDSTDLINCLSDCWLLILLFNCDPIVYSRDCYTFDTIELPAMVSLQNFFHHPAFWHACSRWPFLISSLFESLL